MNEEIKVNDTVFVLLNSGGSVAGVLAMIADYYNAESEAVTKLYRIVINNNKYIDLTDEEIKEMIVYSDDESIAYFKNIQNTYDVQCMDNDNNTRKTLEIVRDMIDKGVWDKWSAEEKETFLRYKCTDSKEIEELIDALSAAHTEKNNLMSKVLELTDKEIERNNAVIEFYDNYDTLSNFLPDAKWVFDLVYQMMHIDSLTK